MRVDDEMHWLVQRYALQVRRPAQWSAIYSRKQRLTKFGGGGRGEALTERKVSEKKMHIDP